MTSAPPERPDHPRFVLGERLGAGGSAWVWRALDRETGEEVALKALWRSRIEERVALKREFELLSQLRHPSLVTVYDLFVDERYAFLTMEAIEGVDLHTYVAAQTAGGTARLRHAALQLGDVLSYLHGRERVHRDVSPWNVKVTPTGRVTLLDLGSFARLGAAADEAPIAGALSTMAPEVAFGGAHGRASDVYSLALVLYECIEGGPPFGLYGGRGLVARSRAAPSRITSAICPSGLATWIARALDPSPFGRPTLDELATSLDAPVRHHGAAWVGREAERELIARVLSEARRGRPTLVCLEGESGMGKTQLIERALGADSIGDARVLRARCSPYAHVPFAGIDGWIDDLRRSGVQETTDVPLELFRMFPALARVLQTSTRDPTPSIDTDRWRGIRSLVALLVGLASERPLVLVVDEGRWLDEDAVDVLVCLLEDLGSRTRRRLQTRVAVLIATQPTTSPVPALVRVAERSGLDVVSIVLSPLAPGPARALVEAGLADPRLVERVIDAAAGHPLLLVELRDHLAASGAPSNALAELVETKLEELSPVTVLILELACIAWAPVPLDVLAAAGALPSAVPQVRALVRRRLLAERPATVGRWVGPMHDRIREVVVARLPERAARLHRALARAFVARNQDHRERAVWHYQAAGDRLEAAEVARAAARVAASHLAFDRVADLLGVVLASDLAPGERAQLLGERARALAATGRGAESARDLAAAADLLPLRAALSARATAADRFFRSGQIIEGQRELDRVLGATGLARARFPRLALLAWTMREPWLRRIERTASVQGRADVPPDVRARLDASYAAASALTWADTYQAGRFAIIHAVEAFRHGSRRDVVRALLFRSAGHALDGTQAGRTRSTQLNARMHVLAGADAELQTLAWLATATTAIFRGSWDDAFAACDECERLVARPSSPTDFTLGDIVTTRLFGMAYASGLETLRPAVNAGLHTARALGDSLTRRVATGGALVAVPLATGALSEARTDAEESLATYAGRPWAMIHAWASQARVLWHLHGGEPERAVEVAETSLREGDRSLLHRVFAILRITTLYSASAAWLGAAWSRPPGRRRDDALVRAERYARLLSRETLGYGRALGSVTEAGVAAARGARGASDLVRVAEAATRGAGLGLIREAVERRGGRAEWGGWVVEPERLAWALAPIDPPPPARAS